MAVRTRKQFGQHWLRSDKVLRQIVVAASLQEGDRIIEIGPGTGALTRQMLDQPIKLIAVEIDRDLCVRLRQKIGDAENFLLLQGDFLEMDLDSLLVNFPAFQQPNKVVANIPYNITGPLLEKLLGTIAHPNPHPFERLVLLVQKEVADRLCARPGSRDFGALSVRVQYLANCERICHVAAGAFHPPPKVDSAVVRITPRTPTLAATNPAKMDSLVRMGFATKRKMLRNNLQSVVDRDRLGELLQQHNLPPTARAEELSAEQWVVLSNQLVESVD